MPEALEKLIVWQKALALADSVHNCVKSFPKDERYELSSQLRRAATSIPSNIAEGYGRRGTNDFVRFLGIARGSAYEVFTDLKLAQLREYDVDESVFVALEEVLRMLNGMIDKLGSKYVREDEMSYGTDELE